MSEATVLTKLLIKINPEGVTFSIEGLDLDLAKLIESASTYKATEVTPRSIGTADVTIESTKAILFLPKTPKLSTTASAVGSDVKIGFLTTPEWETAVDGIYVAGILLDRGQYVVTSGAITILGSALSSFGSGNLNVRIHAPGYVDGNIVITLV